MATTTSNYKSNLSWLQNTDNNNPFNSPPAKAVKKECCTWRAYDVARFVLGISIGCLTMGVLIVYFPMASHIYFTVLAATATFSIGYLIYYACKNRNAKPQAVVQLDS